VGNLLPLPTVK